MRRNHKVLALAAVLAVGMAMAGCGASSSTASSTSVVPASSYVAEEGTMEPINRLTWNLDDLDDPETTTFISASVSSGVQDGSLTAKVFSYDLYKKEEVEDLAVGDKITFHEEGTAWNQYVTAEVSSVEKKVICSSMPILWSLNHQAEPCWILPGTSLFWKQPRIVPI